MVCACTSTPPETPEPGLAVTVVPPDKVWQENGEWVVDPAFVAPSLGLSAEALRRELRAGRVTGTVERGEGEDAGRIRLTFRYAGRAWAVRIEPDGTIEQIEPPTEGAHQPAWPHGLSPPG